MTKAKGFSERDQKLLVGFLLFAELFLGYFLVVDPALSNLHRKEAELAGLKKNIQLTETLFNSQSGPAATSSLPPVFPASGERGAILLQGRMSDWAEQTGNEVLSIEVSPEVQEKPGMLRCALTVGGTYDSLSRLLEQLKNPPFLVGVDKLNVKSLENDRLESRFDLTFLLRPSASSPK